MANNVVGRLSVDGQPEIDLTRNHYRIGRGDDCDIILRPEDGTISRHHATLYCGANGFWTIQDEGSRNGVYVNGNRISGPAPLASGSGIGIGQSRLQFRIAAGPENRNWRPSAPEPTITAVSPYPPPAPGYPYPPAPYQPGPGLPVYPAPPGWIQVAPGTHSVTAAVVLAIFLTGGGQLVNRQTAKGLTILGGALGLGFIGFIGTTVTLGFLAPLFAFVGLCYWIPSLIDAIQIANRLNRGEAVRPWQCF